MPQSCAANPISSQEGGSRCHQVTQGRAAKQPATNPSTGRASRGKLTGSRNYPLKTHLKWKNILDIISSLFYRLANVTNVLGEEKPKLPGLQVSQVVFAGSNYPDWPFFKALHIKRFSLKPPFAEQKAKLGRSSATHFNTCLTLYTVAATNSDVLPVVPTSLLIFFLLRSSSFLNLVFWPPTPSATISSLKRWHTLHSESAEFQQAPAKETLRKTLGVFISSVAEHHRDVIKKHSSAWTFLSQVPPNWGSRWHGEELLQPAQALCCSEDCWLRADLDWPLLAGH